MTNVTNITINQGATYTYTFTIYTPSGVLYDLTGFDARMQARANYGSTNALLNFTVANGKISLGGAHGTITLNFAPTDTSLLRFPNLNDSEYDCYYDVEIISPTSAVYKPASGTFTILREITR